MTANPLYDFIIIGGGPAGTTTATYLVKLGYSVLLFEKAQFPRMHEGESLLPFCYPRFQELGVLDEMKKMFVRKPGARFTTADGSKTSAWCFKTVIFDESYLSFNVERSRFDLMLMDNAIKNGVEVHQETKVESVNLEAPDKIVEVVTTDKNQQTQTWTGKFLIDASGQDTFLAKRMGSKKAYKELDRIAFLGHWVDGKYMHGLEEGLINIVYLEEEKKGWFAIQPIAKNKLSVALIVNRKYLRDQKKLFTEQGIDNWQDAFYRNEIEHCAIAKEILADAYFVDKLLVVSDYSYYADKMYGDNYALIGDAYKFLDPIFSTGVYLAINSARLFSDAIHTKLTSDKKIGDTALSDAFKKMSGGYSLVEKFINIFYDPDSLSLAKVNAKFQTSFEGYETAYSLVHYLLAGDFFNNYEKYATFLDLIKDPSQYSKWKNLVVNKVDSTVIKCGNTYDEIFGNIIEEHMATVS